MSEIKKVSFRINEEDSNKFKLFAEELGLSQAEIFDKLVSTYELANAKSIVSDRSKEIESVENHLAAIQNLYLTSLEINKNAEQTIKEQYSKELNSKDEIIIGLQDTNKNLKEQVNNSKEIEKTNKDLLKQIEELKNHLTKKDNEINGLNESNKTLNSIVNEYKEYKEINIDLEKDIKELREGINIKSTIIKDLENKLSTANKEIDNNKEFYKNEIERIVSDNRQTLSDSKKTYENNIKELKEEHKILVKELKVEYKEEVNELKSMYNLELENKNKIILENTELNNKISIENTSLQKELSLVVINKIELEKELDKLNKAKSKIKKTELNKE